MKVFINDAIVDGEGAMISVQDHGLLYGDGVFEGIRAWSGRVFRLQDHLARLAYGASSLHLTLPYSLEEIASIVQRTVDASGVDEAYIRLVVTRGVGLLGIDIDTCAEPQLFCMVDELKIFPKEKQLAGISLQTSPFRRPGSDMLDPRVKSLNYQNQVQARIAARRSGADEALLLNAAGNIAEASVANIFVVQQGVLCTPPTVDGSLDGMTRRTILELAAAAGIPTAVRSLSRVDLFMAEDAFLTGTGAGLVRISSLDGVQVGKGEPGAITCALLDAYITRTRGGAA